MVLEDGKPINRAAKRLNIRYSTAKLIMKKYRETGKFFMKKKPTIVDLAVAHESEENKVV